MGVGMHREEALTLFIDLGTNGEVVVGNKDWMACAAASAGPAFEGGGIKFGMRASKGAIENFSVDPFTGEPALITVGHAKPKGICGSGLIAIVSSSAHDRASSTSGAISRWSTPATDCGWAMTGRSTCLAWAKDTAIDRDITITEPDVDNLLRAKAAMYAAYMTLLEGRGAFHPGPGAGHPGRRLWPVHQPGAGHPSSAFCPSCLLDKLFVRGQRLALGLRAWWP